MKKVVDIFKALSDPTRLRILFLILKAKSEICSCEICDSLIEPQYSISRNIKVLKYAGLLSERKEGKWVYYFSNRQSEQFYPELYRALEFLPDSGRILKQDLARFRNRLKLREGGKCLIGIQNKSLITLT